MARIKSLTAEQEAMIPGYVERWTRVGLCTDPADRLRAERGVRLAYRAAGLAEPEWIVWCGSPLGQAQTAAIVSSVAVGPSLERAMRGVMWDTVNASVWRTVRLSVWRKTQPMLQTPVRTVWASVWATIFGTVPAMPWESKVASVYGAHDASFFGLYAFFREQCGLVAETDPLRGLSLVAESAGWWVPRKRICWVSERHDVCRLDHRNRVHCEDGPAVAYPDGWAIWAIHGVRVPRRVIEYPEKLRLEEILGEANVEVRRVMMERFGFDRLMREASAELVDDDREHGALWRLRLDSDEPLVMVKVVNATPEPDGSSRNYWLRVPPDMDTAAHAVAWTFDTEPHDYWVVAAS